MVFFFTKSRMKKMSGQTGDAPEFFDDFYLNLIDWSRNNHMAVALYDVLYIWNAVSGSIVELFDKSKDPASQQNANQVWPI